MAPRLASFVAIFAAVVALGSAGAAYHFAADADSLRAELQQLRVDLMETDKAVQVHEEELPHIKAELWVLRGHPPVVQ